MHSVGAALKKAVLALAGDDTSRKKFLVALLSLVAALLIPLLVVCSLLHSLVSADPAQLEQISAGALTQQTEQLSEIQREMERFGFSTRVTEAQALYLYALFAHADEPDFVIRLVACFQDNQTDTQLVAAVNATFGTRIEAGSFSAFIEGLRSTAIDTSGFRSPETKNNLDLVAWAIAAERAGWGYVTGTYGQILTPSLLERKLAQYPQIGDYESFIRQHWLGRRTADCVGLIKSYCWYDPTTDSIRYGTNGMRDINEETMQRIATEKGTIETMPELPGLAVWMSGHIGIYIGGGEVIEASGTERGVIRTKLEDGRWTHWLKVPSVVYLDPSELPEPTLPSSPTTPGTVPSDPPVPTGTTSPAPTQPVPTQPRPTQPAPTQPKPTQPTPTQPKPTEPKPTQPKPTETEPSRPTRPTLPTRPTMPTLPPVLPTLPAPTMEPIVPRP